MIPIFLLAVTITFGPKAPTVGDRITIQVPAKNAPLVLDPSPQFEEVAQLPHGVVIRTFDPRPLTLSGSAGEERFAGVVIPVRSVLKKDDAMEPAPLLPPRKLPYPRAPFVANAAMAAAAVAAWFAVFAYAKRRGRISAPVLALTPVERFRSEVSAANGRWAALADATRHYLASHGYGAELTTRELLAILPEDIRAIAQDVLREGDLEKFSPWGSAARDYNAAAARALTLPDHLEPKPLEEEAAA